MNFIKPFRLMCILRYPSPERAIQCEHAHRSIARWPEMFPTVRLSEGVYSCYEREDAKQLLEKLRKRTPFILARVRRYMSHIELRNLAMAKIYPEKLLKLGCSCLKWHECLPPGVSKTNAAKLTGEIIYDAWWEGQVQRHANYYP